MGLKVAQKEFFTSQPPMRCKPDVCDTASALSNVTNVRLKPALRIAIAADHGNGLPQDACSYGCVTELDHGSPASVREFELDMLNGAECAEEGLHVSLCSPSKAFVSSFHPEDRELLGQQLQI